MSAGNVAARIAALMPPSWPYHALDELRENIEGIERGMDGLDVLVTLNEIHKASENLSRIAGQVVEVAAKNTKLTQKRVAAALDIPPSMLRGWRS